MSGYCFFTNINMSNHYLATYFTTGLKIPTKYPLKSVLICYNDSISSLILLIYLS